MFTGNIATDHIPKFIIQTYYFYTKRLNNEKNCLIILRITKNK